MRTSIRSVCVMSLSGLFLLGGNSSDLQGKGPKKKRNPRTTVIIHFDDGQTAKPDHAGKPKNDPPPPGDGVSYSLIGGYWADNIPQTPDVVDPNLTFVFDPSGFPAGTYVQVLNSFLAWEERTQGRLLDTIVEEVGVDVILGDGINTYSMRNLGGGGVLAATYITWDDANGDGAISVGEEYLEMDVIHNYIVNWAIAEDVGGKGRWWDIANVATHEIGHVYGLGHSGSDESVDYEQTMFASAPAKEIKKRTLEAGDIMGIQRIELGYGAASP